MMLKLINKTESKKCFKVKYTGAWSWLIVVIHNQNTFPLKTSNSVYLVNLKKKKLLNEVDH